VANHTRTRPPGGWIFNSTISGAEFDKLDSNGANSLSASGGVYAPADLFTIGGAGVTITGPFNTDTAEVIQVSTSLTVKLGASFQLIGNTVVNSGAAVGFTSGSFLTVNSGGLFTMNAGSTANIAATTTLSGTTTISGALTINNTTAINNTVTINDSNVVNYDAPRIFPGKCFGAFNVSSTYWQPEAAAPFSWPARAEQIAAGATPPTGHLVYEADMPAEATIISVTTWVKPGTGHSAVPGFPPVMYVYLYDSSLGTTTLLGFDTLVAGSVGVYELRTQLSVTCPANTIVTSGKRVIIYVRGEGGSDYENGLLVDSPQTTYSVAALPLG